jgi:hypothetical protein
MTIRIKRSAIDWFFLAFSLLLCRVGQGSAAQAQTATSLKSAQSVFVGSLGIREGAEDLRRELVASLQHIHRFKLVPGPEQADLVLEGHGELRFIEWMLTSGQLECSSLGYAPLPKKMVIRELAAAHSLE